MTYAQVEVSANTELVTETDEDGNAMETFTYNASEGECKRDTVLNFFNNMYSITSSEVHPDETCCYYAKLGHSDPSTYDTELKAACTPEAHEG